MRKTFCILEWRHHPHGFFVAEGEERTHVPEKAALFTIHLEPTGEVVIHPKLPTGGWHLRPVSMHLK
jgi:hypothetical protein